MKKFFASPRFSGMVLLIQFILIAFGAFIILLCVSGIALVTAGIDHLLVNSRRHIFGYASLAMCGIMGFLSGAAVQEVLSGYWPTPYLNFLMDYWMVMMVIVVLLFFAHLVMKNRHRHSIH